VLRKGYEVKEITGHWFFHFLIFSLSLSLSLHKMNSIPLTDILPWGDGPPISNQTRTILVCDSAETDGRFILHTVASQCLSSSSSSSSRNNVIPTIVGTAMNEKHYQTQKGVVNVIWINCGMHTDEQIEAAMKKIGCDLRTGNVKNQNSDSTKKEALHIVNIKSILNNYFSGNIQESIDGDESLNALKKTYREVSTIVKEYPKAIVIVDDATNLSLLCGASNTVSFIQTLQSFLKRASKDRHFVESETNQNGLVIRVSHDLDQEHYIQSQSGIDMNVSGSKSLNYIGAGGRGMSSNFFGGSSEQQISHLVSNCEYELGSVAWERLLVETADGIVDVMPLTSGFSRDVHGRLVFTQRLGGIGWKDENEPTKTASATPNVKSESTSANSRNFLTSIVNYCCSDAGVRAIRLRVQ
jgi:hypothetical protein